MRRSRLSASPSPACCTERVARYAIGDIQGCYDELRELLASLRYSSDRDELWFVGDLVNRGPKSLEVLRFVRSLGAAATVVLGNHDLHLLAVALGSDARGLRRGDTLDAVLAARDRDVLLEWLLTRPLAHHDEASGDLLIHAGLVPQWNAAEAARLAREVERALATDARDLFDHMYGDRPDRWSAGLEGHERLRFIVNALTRLRYCTREGRVDLRFKGAPHEVEAPLAPWFSFGDRTSRGARIICGHWSAIGYRDTGDVVLLDSGCVWGGSLTALRLDGAPRPPVSVGCAGYSAIGGE